MKNCRWMATMVVLLTAGCGSSEPSNEVGQNAPEQKTASSAPPTSPPSASGQPSNTRTVAADTARAQASTQPTDQPARSVDTRKPGEIARDFLQAMKEGDDQTTRNLLTQAARDEAERSGVDVAPPGTATAKYDVGQTRYIGEKQDAAYVASTWTEQINENESMKEEVVWILKKTPDGWRIAGMSNQVLADLPPVVWNFEDHADMERKQEMLAEEIARRQNQDAQAPGTLQASKPDDANAQLK